MHCPQCGTELVFALVRPDPTDPDAEANGRRVAWEDAEAEALRREAREEGGGGGSNRGRTP